MSIELPLTLLYWILAVCYVYAGIFIVKYDYFYNQSSGVLYGASLFFTMILGIITAVYIIGYMIFEVTWV